MIMKHHYPNILLEINLLRKVGIILLLLVFLYGCAGKQSVKVETQTGKAPVVVSAEARAEFDAAMVSIKAEDYEKGIALMSKVVKMLPDNAIPSINLALAYKKLGKLKLAEESLKLALNIDPENPVANNEYALLYRKTGRFNEARKLYEKTLEKYPNFNMAHKNLGIICDLYLKDYECALHHYVIYSNMMQDDKTVKIWIADIQKRLGK